MTPLEITGLVAILVVPIWTLLIFRATFNAIKYANNLVHESNTAQVESFKEFKDTLSEISRNKMIHISRARELLYADALHHERRMKEMIFPIKESFKVLKSTADPIMDKELLQSIEDVEQYLENVEKSYNQRTLIKKIDSIILN